MKIHIPNSAFLGNINTLLSGISLRNPDHLDITANEKWISIHPLGLAIIAALGKQVSPSRINCDKIIATSGHYLHRMGLFDFLGVSSPTKKIEEHEEAGRFIPIQQIRTSSDLDSFIKELIPLLHLEKEKHSRAIQHIFSELIRNVIEHSQSKSGAIVCAQYFKKSNKIAIGVVDYGIGLRKSLSKSYHVKDDLHAIELALTPGVTGTTPRPGGTAQNAGFGLFLIKSIAYINSDYFNIISGNKMFKLLQRKSKKTTLNENPFKDRHSIMHTPKWEGVAVGVDISLDQTLEFTAMLNTVHRFYTSSVKGKKKVRYKKPRFVT